MEEWFFPTDASSATTAFVELSPFENNVKTYAWTGMAVVFKVTSPLVATESLSRLRRALPKTLAEFSLFNSVVFEAEPSDASVVGRRALFGGVWASLNDPRFMGIPLTVAEQQSIDAETVFPATAGVSLTCQQQQQSDNGGDAGDSQKVLKFTDCLIPSGASVGYARGGGLTAVGGGESTVGGSAALLPPVALQFTFLNGGFSVGFCATHCVADAASASLFIRRWCARASGGGGDAAEDDRCDGPLARLPLPLMGPDAYRFPVASSDGGGGGAAFPADLPLLKADLWQSGGDGCPFYMEGATKIRPSVAKAIEAGDLPQPFVGARADWEAILPPMYPNHPNPDRFGSVEERVLLFTPEVVNQIAAAATEQARELRGDAGGSDGGKPQSSSLLFSRQTSLVAHIARCVLKARLSVGGLAERRDSYAVACTVGMRPRVPAVVALERGGGGKGSTVGGGDSGAPIENANLLIGSPIALFSAELAANEDFANGPNALGAVALAITDTLSAATEQNVERLATFLQEEPCNEHCWLTSWGDRALIYTSWANLGLYTVAAPAEGASVLGCHSGMVAADGILQMHEANPQRFGKGGFQVLLVLRGDVMDALLKDPQLFNVVVGAAA